MKGRARQLFFRFGGPLFLTVLAWEAFSRAGLLHPLIFPPPSWVLVRALGVLGDPLRGQWGILEGNFVASTLRVATGFAAAAAAGVVVGALMGASRWVRRALEPVAGVLIPIPMLAWTPIFLMAFGRGDRTVTSVVFLAVFFPVLYNTAAGVRTVSKHHQWALEALGAGRLDLLFKCWLPGALPFIMTGLRLGMGFGWRALVAAEMLGADRGLGAMIFAARTYMDTQLMYVGIALLGLCGFFFEHVLFGYLERRTVERWGLMSA